MCDCLSVGCLMSVNPEVNQASMDRTFWKKYFQKYNLQKVPLQMFEKVLNTPLPTG